MQRRSVCPWKILSLSQLPVMGSSQMAVGGDRYRGLKRGKVVEANRRIPTLRGNLSLVNTVYSVVPHTSVSGTL